MNSVHHERNCDILEQCLRSNVNSARQCDLIVLLTKNKNTSLIKIGLAKYTGEAVTRILKYFLLSRVSLIPFGGASVNHLSTTFTVYEITPES